MSSKESTYFQIGLETGLAYVEGRLAWSDVQLAAYRLLDSIQTNCESSQELIVSARTDFWQGTAAATFHNYK